MKNNIDLNNKTVLISRTDSIGDVVLTLPMCVWIKNRYPNAKILFLGNTYTKPVLECMPQIDEILLWHDLQLMDTPQQIAFLAEKNIDVFIHVFPRKALATLAKQARIPLRIGTLNRFYHLFSCNIRPYFSRKNSDLSESQLNFELLRVCGLTQLPSLDELSQWMLTFTPPSLNLPEFIAHPLSSGRPSVILHAKSQGSALEWPIDKYLSVAQALLKQNYTVIFSGTEKEGAMFRDKIPLHPHCIDTTGRLSLSELIKLIACCDGLVACSTGPLHLAGIMGRKTIGLFSSRKPIHPARWRPLGRDVHTLVNDAQCPICKSKKPCRCIEQIDPQRVLDILNRQ